jgi:hypothetical protein
MSKTRRISALALKMWWNENNSQHLITRSNSSSYHMQGGTPKG